MWHPCAPAGTRAAKRGDKIHKPLPFYSGISTVQQPLILVEPLPSPLVIRHDPSDLLPELLRMVRLDEMDQFMHQHIIDNLRWCLDQAPAEVDNSLVGARSPSLLGI